MSDAGLAHLKGLSKLRYLSLDGTNITDGGLPHLQALSSLKDLRLGRTMVSKVGVRKLTKAMPNVRLEPSVHEISTAEP